MPEHIWPSPTLTKHFEQRFRHAMPIINQDQSHTLPGVVYWAVKLGFPARVFVFKLPASACVCLGAITDLLHSEICRQITQISFILQNPDLSPAVASDPKFGLSLLFLQCLPYVSIWQ